MATASGNQLVLVTYYLASAEQVADLVTELQAAIGLEYDRVVIVDNGGAIVDAGPVGARMTVLRGTNRFYEFSGWLEGLAVLGPVEGGIITLLNDSFGRNWTISAASRPILAAMVADARAGKIAGWLDNFSYLTRPYFARRPNSRIVMIAPRAAAALAASLAAAIDQCESQIDRGEALFDAASQTRLDRWTATQHGRWSGAALTTRAKRIFVEHHLFDEVPPALLSLRPRYYLSSLMYAASRRFHREAR